MKLLAFDTNLSACSIAILKNNERIFIDKIAPKQQAHLILPLVQEALIQANLKLHELDGIAYACGPGSFTGLRIASSVAQGLAFPNNTPVIQISSLALLAQSAYEANRGKHFYVAIDARMKKIYWAEYIVNKQDLVELIGSEQAYKPEDIILTANDDVIGIGDGWKFYQNILSPQLDSPMIPIYPDQNSTAQALLNLAVEKFNREGGVTAANAIPVYLS